jgi:transcriptional regulator of nitric oxide reductase
MPFDRLPSRPGRRAWFCRIVLTLCAAAALVAPLAGQNSRFGFIDPMPTARLRQLFPGAAAFTPRGADPMHFTAYAVDPKAQPGARPLGFAFWTTDLVPGELGYHGHIHMLIGIIVDFNTEPYGEISIERPEFPAQFRGKSIRAKFMVREDIDIVSRATITTRAAALEIRDAARMVAKAVLSPGDVK